MAMLMTGSSLRTVGVHFNVSHNVIWSSSNDTRFAQQRQGGERNRSTTVRRDRFITVISRMNRFSTVRPLQIH